MDDPVTRCPNGHSIGTKKGVTPAGACSRCCPACGKPRGSVARRDRPGGACQRCYGNRKIAEGLQRPLTPQQAAIYDAVQAGAWLAEIAETMGGRPKNWTASRVRDTYRRAQAKVEAQTKAA